MKHSPAKLGLVLSVFLLDVPGCGAADDAEPDTETDPATDTAPSEDIFTHLPPPVAQACGAGELADDRFCVTSCLADVDPIAAEKQIQCGVTEISTDADGATVETELLACGEGGVLPPGATACFNVFTDAALSAECINDGYPVEIEVVRAESSEAGCRIEQRCELSSNKQLDCPDFPDDSGICGDGICALGEGCTDCPLDCGGCGEYSTCDEQSDCSEPTQYCAAPPVFENGGGMCTVACDEYHRCPEFIETGSRGDCMDGMCVIGCDAVDDEGCPAGMTCVDLGPISPAGNVFVCMP